MSGNINDNDIVFFDETSAKVTAPSSLPSQPLPYVKPADDLSPHTVTADTVFYLAVTAPHTDKYEVHGPASFFGALVPTIIDVASSSPPGLYKIEHLAEVDDEFGNRVENEAFTDCGFHTMVLEGQRGAYTVLEVITEENAEVKALLPVPVYTVTRHGPLVNTFSLVNTFTGEGGKQNVGAAKGVAATSAIVSCFAEKKAALEAAKNAMDRLVEGVEGVNRSEAVGQGPEGGVLMAAKSGVMWEVRVKYTTEVLKVAKEKAEAEGKELEWRF